MTHSIPLLDLSREYAHIAAEVQELWAQSMSGMHLLNGPQVTHFEQEIAAYLGVAHARGVSSGTDALILGLAALGVGPGDRVILPANAFVAALEAVHHCGATPVLVDAAEVGFGPDVAAVAAALPAKAVIVVHLYGAPLDCGPLAALCQRHGAVLVEDASHAHGARRGARFAGSFGAIGCFSAGVVKNLGAYGDAGFITTGDAAVAEAVTLLQRHGQRKKNDHVRYGYNCRLDELQAAVLRVKLRHLEARNQRRRDIAAFYNARFAPLGIGVPAAAAGEVPVYHQYVIRTERRDALQQHLKTQGVDTGIHYPVPLHRQPAWASAYGTTLAFPRAERIAREILSLPVFPDLTDAEVETVATGVESFFAGRQPARTSREAAVRVPAEGVAR